MCMWPCTCPIPIPDTRVTTTGTRGSTVVTAMATVTIETAAMVTIEMATVACRRREVCWRCRRRWMEGVWLRACPPGVAGV